MSNFVISVLFADGQAPSTRRTSAGAVMAMMAIYMHPANERRRYNVTSSLIRWAHTWYDPWFGHRVYTGSIPETLGNFPKHSRNTLKS